MIFYDAYPITLDNEGRFSLPFKFHEVLDENGINKLVVTVNEISENGHPYKCSCFYPTVRWNKCDENEKYFGIVTIDEYGKIDLLEDVRNELGITHNSKLKCRGVITLVEIWEEEMWDRYYKDFLSPWRRRLETAHSIR